MESCFSNENALYRHKFLNPKAHFNFVVSDISSSIDPTL